MSFVYYALVSPVESKIGKKLLRSVEAAIFC